MSDSNSQSSTYSFFLVFLSSRHQLSHRFSSVDVEDHKFLFTRVRHWEIIIVGVWSYFQPSVHRKQHDALYHPSYCLSLKLVSYVISFPFLAIHQCSCSNTSVLPPRTEKLLPSRVKQNGLQIQNPNLTVCTNSKLVCHFPAREGD